MVKILSLALVGLLMLSASASGTTSDLTTLDPVIVTATRIAQPASQIPSSTTVITADEIISSGARDLGEVLRETASVDISSNGPLGATALAKIRGSSAEQVLVLLDGIRLNSEQNGTFDLSNLPISLKDIERIEIVRGPSSALYGSAATGGVIQIFTHKPEARPSTAVNWNEGSYDTRNIGISQSWRPGSIYYRISGSADRSHGYRNNSELSQETYNGLLGLDLPGGYNLEASAYHIDKENGVPGSSTIPSPSAEQRDVNTFSQLQLKGPAGPINLTAKVIYNRQRSELENPDYSEDDTHILETIGTEILSNWKHGIHNLVFGGDYYNDNLDSTANGDQEQQRWSLFSQYEITPTDWAKALFGLRFDDHSDFRSVFSPRVGLVLTVHPNTIIHISAGKSFRAPTLNDRFWPSVDYGYYAVEGNPDLKPETAWEYEVGLKQALGEWGNFNLAGFMRQAKDQIIWDEGDDGWWRPYNVTKSRTWGAEAEFDLVLSKQIRWGANYTFLRPKDRNSNEYLPNIPHHQIGSYLEFGPFWDTNLRLSGRYVRYYKDTSRKHPSYMVFDATLTRPLVLWKNLEVEFTIAARNILDKDYEINNGYPMPPAEIQIGLTAYF